MASDLPTYLPPSRTFESVPSHDAFHGVIDYLASHGDDNNIVALGRMGGQHNT